MPLTGEETFRRRRNAHDITSRWFVTIALAWLLIGMLQGFWMGAASALQFKDMHVAMMMPGFVLLATYGILGKLWPEIGEGQIARWQFWIANLGTLTIVLGSWQLAFDNSNILVVAIGSAIAIVGAALFAYNYVVATGRVAA